MIDQSLTIHPGSRHCLWVKAAPLIYPQEKSVFVCGGSQSQWSDPVCRLINSHFPTSLKTRDCLGLVPPLALQA